MKGDTGKRLPISRVVIGPSPRQEAAEVFVHHLLARYEYDSVPVETVDSPFRDW